MLKIHLKGLERQVIFIASGLFDKIVHMDNADRQDEKARTGLQVLIRQLNTDNVLNVSVYQPSPLAKFFVSEKSVRTEILGDACSQNSADKAKSRYPGCIMVVIDGIQYHVSVSGLKAEEDVAVAVYLAAWLGRMTANQVCFQIIKNLGVLPEGLLPTRSNYLHSIVVEVWDEIPLAA